MAARVAAPAPQQGRAGLRRRCSCVIVVAVPARAGVRQRHRAHRARRTESPTSRSRRRQDRRTSSRRPASRSGRPGTARFFLGADANGRDVAVRLLYGGRNSLEIGAIATLITMVLALILGIARRATSAGSPTACSRDLLDVDLGLPGGAAGRRARRVARRRRARPRALQHQRQLAARARGRDRVRLHPVRGQAGARPGADAARARVRRRRAPAGPQPLADHVHARSCPTSPRRSSCSSR